MQSVYSVDSVRAELTLPSFVANYVPTTPRIHYIEPDQDMEEASADTLQNAAAKIFSDGDKEKSTRSKVSAVSDLGYLV